MTATDKYKKAQSENHPQKRNRRRRRQMRLMVFVLPVLALSLLGLTSLLSGAVQERSGPPDLSRSSSSYPVKSSAPDLREPEADRTAPQALGDVHGEEDFEPGDWQLILVNPWNSLSVDYEFPMVQLKSGHAVDERCYPDLQQMLDDCRDEGFQPLVCSAYRSQGKQQQLFDNKVNSLIAQGYPRGAAREKAATIVAVPGTSEHHTGLAVDIVDINNQNLDESQENTPAQQWLMQNSWRYGFILRYLSDKSDITGIIYEPWHYRYVGRETAQEIFEQGICLEEYLNS